MYTHVVIIKFYLKNNLTNISTYFELHVHWTVCEFNDFGFRP